jgi:hypothetical protein
MIVANRFSVTIAIVSLVKTNTLVSATDAPTKSPTAPPTVYAGTSKWYVSYEDQVCKQDCEVANGSDCGGITRDSFTIANGLYATAEACCSARLSYLDVNYCEDRSLATPVGTGMYYADPSEGHCLKDAIPATAADGEGEAEPTDKLYASPETCCSAMSWIPSAYCLARSPTTSAAPVGYSGKWFVDYTDSVCKADCDPVTPFTGIPSDADASGAACEEATLQTYQYYDDAAACCKAHLGWIPSATCEAVSTTGVSASSTGTNKWYADYSDSQHCVKDCATGGSDATCGGILENVAGVTLFDDAESCCKQKFTWIDQDLCEALAGGTYTDKWYVSYQDNACVQDCEYDAADANTIMCGGNPDDSSSKLFATVEICCSTMLGWVDADMCKTVSEGGTVADPVGTNKWYAAYGDDLCVKDCATGGSDDTCGGIVENTAGMSFFDDAAACCESKFAYVDKDLCAAISDPDPSDGVYTSKFYADTANNKCVQDCDVAGGDPCDGTPDDLSTRLYDTKETCCSSALGWLKSEVCIANTDGTAATGSDNWYVNWAESKCVQDCPEADGGNCGGIAESWDVLYSSSSACCERLSWVPASECT